MKKKLFLLATGASLLLSAALLSCQKELSNELGGAITPVTVGSPILPPTPVEASVSGIVTDENDQPVANAPVTIGGTTYMTDSKGFFNSAKHTLDKYISTVQVNMPGYFKAIRSFCANPTRNYVAIKLIPKTLAGTFNSASASSISLINGTQISFTAGSIVNKATGAAYTGNVKVYSAYIDPTASDISARIPGSLMGQDNSNMYILASAGMIAVELESDGGVPLQIATGKSAAVKLLIPASLQSSAPATMATWSLDDRGVWKKEATATKNGNYYEFEASHFSYWNCDIPNSSIYLNLHVTDQHNQPLSNAYVDIRPTSANLWSHCGGMTDSLGNGTAFVPANEVLNLSVRNNYVCNTATYAQSIGPYSANSNVNITATITSPNYITVQGTALDCSNAPVASGRAIIYAGYNVYHVAITNGSFSYTIYACSSLSSVEIIAIDNATQQQSATNTVAVSSNTANAGSINACGVAATEFINYTVDGTPFSILPAANAYLYASVAPNITTNIIGGSQGSTLNSLSFSTPGTTTGTFGISNDSLSVNTFYNAIPQPSAAVTFTAFGTVGQFIEGSFNLPFTHSSTGATVHTCSGTFRIRRN